MNALYNAVSSRACTTDCPRFAAGTCLYKDGYKHKCYRWIEEASHFMPKCDNCARYPTCGNGGLGRSGKPACGLFEPYTHGDDDSPLTSYGPL